MIIDVKQPTFILDMNTPKNFSYTHENSDNTKLITVETYAFGFPELKPGEILYRYTNNRGYIHKIENKKEI